MSSFSDPETMRSRNFRNRVSQSLAQAGSTIQQLLFTSSLVSRIFAVYGSFGHSILTAHVFRQYDDPGFVAVLSSLQREVQWTTYLLISLRVIILYAGDHSQRDSKGKMTFLPDPTWKLELPHGSDVSH